MPERFEGNRLPELSRREILKWLSVVGMSTVLGAVYGSLVRKHNAKQGAQPSPDVLPTPYISPSSAFDTPSPGVETAKSSEDQSDLLFDPDLVAETKKRYGARLLPDAMKIISNGTRIRRSPQKETAQARIKQHLQEKYSRRIKIPRLFGFIDDPKELLQLTSILYYRDDVLERAKKYGVDLPLSFIIAAMSNEGHLLNISEGEEKLWKEGVTGWHALGLDWFAEEFDELTAKNLLTPSFQKQFQETEFTNEKGEITRSASFKTKGAAINAFIAELAFRQILFLKDLAKVGISLDALSNEEQKDIQQFFTYIYYNGGKTRGWKIVRRFQEPQDMLTFFRRIIEQPQAVDLRSAPANSYVVMAGAEWLERTGACDLHAEETGDYWWLGEKEQNIRVAKN